MLRSPETSTVTVPATAVTVIEAVAALPAPASFELTVLVVFVFTPAVVAVTLMLNVQVVLAASDAPARESAPPDPLSQRAFDDTDNLPADILKSRRVDIDAVDGARCISKSDVFVEPL